MRSRRHRRYILSILLILIGSAGILLSPSIGVRGGTEQRQFSVKSAIETELATAVVVSHVELPYVTNGKGLAWMHLTVFLSVSTLFSGVHLLSRVQRRLWPAV